MNFVKINSVAISELTCQNASTQANFRFILLRNNTKWQILNIHGWNSACKWKIKKTLQMSQEKVQWLLGNENLCIRTVIHDVRNFFCRGRQNIKKLKKKSFHLELFISAFDMVSLFLMLRVHRLTVFNHRKRRILFHNES